MMPDLEFRELVRKMMDAQTDYFRTRDKDCLTKAKRLEATVRKELGPDPNNPFPNLTKALW